MNWIIIVAYVGMDILIIINKICWSLMMNSKLCLWPLSKPPPDAEIFSSPLRQYMWTVIIFVGVLGPRQSLGQLMTKILIFLSIIIGVILFSERNFCTRFFFLVCSWILQTFWDTSYRTPLLTVWCCCTCTKVSVCRQREKMKRMRRRSWEWRRRLWKWGDT